MTKRLTNKEFIERAKIVHGEKYDYSKVEYKKSSSAVTIVCSIHGEFQQRPNDHLSGNGCRSCSISAKYDRDRAIRSKEMLDKFLEVHGGFYTYDMSGYHNNTSLLDIMCPAHGIFQQTADSHASGRGCPECGLLKFKKSRVENSGKTLIERFRESHGDKYDYTKVSYSGYYSNVEIICREHGSFMQPPERHLSGQGCPKCASSLRSRQKTEAALLTLEARFRQVHGDTYEYDLTGITTLDSDIKMKCATHGEFSQYAYNHLGGSGCPKCSAALGTSKAENQLFEFLQNLTGCAEQSNRVVLQGRELDVFVESKNVAVEFDGIYWHSSRSKETDFFHQQRHVEKTEECLEQGIRLFHVFEDEWLNKRLIWESVLTNALRMTPDRIYARLCQVRGISSEDASRFLKDNHLQGSCGSKIKLGLFYQDELVSVMTFGKPRYNKQHDWELLRFCNLAFTNVVGAAGKLFSYFLKNYEGDVVSYANRRWSEGGVYEKLGFSLVSKTEPSYYYSKDGELSHRSSFMKHKLSSVLDDFNQEMSEVENMYKNGYSRIWDCGQYTYSFRR